VWVSWLDEGTLAVRMKRTCNSKLDKVFLQVTSECTNENISGDENNNFKTDDEDSQQESKLLCI
jgi:hypothetical protein